VSAPRARAGCVSSARTPEDRVTALRHDDDFIRRRRHQLEGQAGRGREGVGVCVWAHRRVRPFFVSRADPAECSRRQMNMTHRMATFGAYVHARQAETMQIESKWGCAAASCG
jgi:hypothetical protein